MKKLLFTFVVLLLPMTASADYGFEFNGGFSHWGEPDAVINDIYYQLNPSDQTASVTYKTVCPDDMRDWPVSDYSGDIVIPSQVIYKGVTYTVTSIDDYAFNNTHDSGYGYSLINRSSLTSITSVTIPNTVTSIGNRAFENCRELNSITIVGNLNSIGGGAFCGCSSLTSISLPSSVLSIGEYAFAGCSNLTNISIPNNVTSIGEYTFYNCSGLQSITLSDKLASVEMGTFSNCTSLISVSIPDKVSSIADNAFNGCSNLTTVTIGYYLSSIGSSFHNCNKLSNVYCYAPVPPSYSAQPFDEEVVYSNSLFLYVPSSSLDDYKNYWMVTGADPVNGWCSISWSNILPIPGQGSQKLDTPTILITNGVLKFDCGTDGAEYHYSITYPESKSNAVGNNVQLPSSYTISVYAVKAGYEKSDTATKEIKNGDLNGDGNVDVGDHVELTNIIMAP
jgi:hypothetical protein